MIAGLEGITGGEIAIDGTVVNAFEPRERGCAMVFQNYALYPHMNVADNIGYALKVAGVGKAERRREVEEIARSVSLEPYLDRKPSQLSGGQRQRVAMARAMIRKPKVFLFDEPLSNLDAQLRVQMRAEIRRLHRRLGTTSVFVTHDQAEAMTLADRLVVMRAGRIEQVGTPAEIYGRPATRFVAGFIGSPPMNLIAGCIDATGAFHPTLHATPPLPIGRSDLAGRSVVLGLRPESLVLGAPRSGSPSATVDFVEDLGPSRIVHLDWDGQVMTAVTASGEPPAVGTTVGITIAYADIHLFDAESGARLPDRVAAPLAIA
jgi:sn-glycerol 3-phosphate transport system ATP-binding protein